MMSNGKPQKWDDFGMAWDVLPVLAAPIRHGWALYEAIRERIAYLYGDAWKTAPDLPGALAALAPEFNPCQDYKRAEMVMHNAVTELFAHFRNPDVPGRPFWTEEAMLAAIGDPVREMPSPVFLRAAWLWQMYHIVNRLEKVQDIVSITWIDEADPDYVENRTGKDLFYQDRADFEASIPFRVAVIQPGGENAGEIFPAGDCPQNVAYYSCRRDPCDDIAPFIAAFQELAAQYHTDRLTVGLFIDASGSMGIQTIQPGLQRFEEWIASNYPRATVIKKTAGNERWLHWTQDYIRSLFFRFRSTSDKNPLL